MDQQYWYEEQKHLNGMEHSTPKRTKTVSFATLIVCMLVTGLLGGAFGGLLSAKQPFAIAGQALPNPPESQQQQIMPPSEPSAETSGSAQPHGNAGSDVITASLPAGQTYTKKQLIEISAPSIVGIDVQAEGGSDWYGRSTMLSGSGSGIIISTDGYIVTNNHVVSGATAIKVYLNDDSEYAAELIGSDEKTDLAVIKIEATGLSAARLGDSDALAVGDDVVAIGNPLGELRGTATSGMISALSRTITIEDQEMTLLQTDAAINPGNSGGGLFNMHGELVGVVNAKVASSSTEGLGFAIPVNNVKSVITDLIDRGYVSGRARLGVYTQNIALQSNNSVDGRGDYGIQDFFGIIGGQRQSVQTVVQIVSVNPGSAAANAGIQANDILLTVDGASISTGTELQKKIGEYNAGDSATITVQRENEELTFDVVFDEYIPD